MGGTETIKLCVVNMIMTNIAKGFSMYIKSLSQRENLEECSLA